MSRTEQLSQFDPDTDIPDSQFESTITQLSVTPANRLMQTDSEGNVVDKGPFKIASAVYIVGGRIDELGRLVLLLSDGQEVVHGKVTNESTYPVTLVGEGLLVGHNKSELQFQELTTDFPMVLDDGELRLVQSRGLRLDRHLRIENRGPFGSGRFYSTVTPIRSQPMINTLGASFVDHIFTLPAGEYYVRINAQQYRGNHAYIGLVNANTNAVINNVASVYSGDSGSGAQFHHYYTLVLTEDTPMYFGGFVTSVGHTQTYGWGVSSLQDTTHVYDIFNTAEIWRIDE